jgi:hypothetical protein
MGNLKGVVLGFSVPGIREHKASRKRLSLLLEA